MSLALFIDKAIGIYVGRDWCSDGRRWLADIAIIPRRDLTPEGCLVLAGLRVTLRFKPPFSRGTGSRVAMVDRHDYYWKWPVGPNIHSDADRIATVMAG